MTENILIAIGILLLILVFFLVPLIIQARRTVKNMSQTLEIINRDLPAIMKNLEEITTNVNLTTTIVKHEVTEISMTLKRIQGVVGLVFGVSDVLRRRMSFPLEGTVKSALAAFRGVRTFVQVFMGENRGNAEGRQ